MTPPAPKKYRPTSAADVGPPVTRPDEPTIIASEIFISRVEPGALTAEERIEQLDAIMKLLGLPSVAEVNRMDAEAEAAARKRSTKSDG